MKRILILCPYPPQTAPSQRFRFEQYLSQLSERYMVSLEPFFSHQGYRSAFQNGKIIPKIIAITASYVRRFAILFKARPYHFILVHREAAPAGPPVVEWVLAKILRKKIVYDFDDAIWLTDDVHESRFEKIIRWRRKVRLICRWSYKISCGNDYLAAYARQFNANVVVNPTTIDLEHVHNRRLYPGRSPDRRLITLGWTGSRTTLKYLGMLEPVLKHLASKYEHLRVLVIADRRPGIAVNNLLFREWSRESEVSDLMLADIGLMPLPDDEWARGKCGFKALQYMALGIPPVVSPVGVNTTIVQHGYDGYVCHSEAEWLACLKALIADPALREQMGANARRKVEQSYSVASNLSNFLSLFQ